MNGRQRPTRCVAVQYPLGPCRLGQAFVDSEPLRPRSREGRAMEPRRLYCRGTRPLRILPHAARRRDAGDSVARRWPRTSSSGGDRSPPGAPSICGVHLLSPTSRIAKAGFNSARRRFRPHDRSRRQAARNISATSDLAAVAHFLEVAVGCEAGRAANCSRACRKRFIERAAASAMINSAPPAMAATATGVAGHIPAAGRATTSVAVGRCDFRHHMSC